jgi:nickel/cobalt exporter
MKPAVWRRAFIVGLVLAALPIVASAHPLGNFTINHYAGIRVAADAVTLDVVIDMAEIPTFQERQRIDTDGDGSVSDAEASRERVAACRRLAPDLHLLVGGAPLPLQLTAAGLIFPTGAGGLSTMRLVCEYHAPIAGRMRSGQRLHFEDTSYAERIGWREIVVEGDGVAVNGQHLAGSVSHRLTRYPAQLLSTPRDDRSVDLLVAAGGDRLAADAIPEAQPIDGLAARSPLLAASVPGGEQLTALLGGGDLSPLALLLSLVLAAGLGALHGLSPGHGKTVMAAYLVGSRGSARHAVVLGLIVTAAHTVGVVGLALVTLLASDFLPPERLYPILGLSSGAIVIGIGLYLLTARWRAVTAARRHRLAHAHSGELGHGQHHGHDHIPPGPNLSWRALFSLGLAGGLVPSASALLLLLGAIAAGQPAYGLALAIAFGVGMAIVLSGIGILMVRASRFVQLMPQLGGLARFTPALPWMTAVIVLVAGIYLTGQALTRPL